MSEINLKTLCATIQETLDLSKVKIKDLELKITFKNEEQAYALLNALLPKKGKSKTVAAAPKEEAEAEAPTAADAEKPKKIKKAKVVTATEAEMLAPADGDGAAAADAPTLGATDEFRGNKYRLQTLNPTLCVARKIDEANTIAGTRPGDEGANGKVFPEKQCSKKPIAGGRLCATCAKKETECLADTAKVPKGWYGRLDEELFHKSYVVGCEWFLANYPSGIEDARPSAAAAKADKPKKVKKAEASTSPAEEEKPKKAKKAPAPPTEEAAEESEPAPTMAEKPKKVKKDKAAPAPAPTEEEEEEEKPAPKPVTKKASVASSSAPKNVEWITFLADGTLLIRHTKTGNVYQCDRSKHRLEDMVQRDKFEGKWRDGRLDPYADEEDE
jgi:hypothetical protein